jgi:NADPH:quinone reductase-like Zn-dependent oxidoreductase
MVRLVVSIRLPSRLSNRSGLKSLAFAARVKWTWHARLGPIMSLTTPNQKDLAFLKELLEVGKVVPVIDRRYTLSDVPEALRYLEEGHAQGKVVITVEHNDKT